jgi:hypothetical protein
MSEAEADAANPAWDIDPADDPDVEMTVFGPKWPEEAEPPERLPRRGWAPP